MHIVSNQNESAMRWILLLFIAAFTVNSAQALRHTLHPLSARQVYRLLAQTGRSNAIPEGRIITQGLTFINNLGQRLIGNGGGANGAGTASQVRISTQEVCFETRSARSLREAELVYDAYVASTNRREDDERGTQKRVRNSEVARILKLKKRKKLRDNGEVEGKKRLRNNDEESLSLPGSVSATGTGTGSGTAAAEYNDAAPLRSTVTSDPVTTAALTNTNMAAVATKPEVTVKKKKSDAIISTFTTSTTPEGSINCIIIKKNE